MKYRITRCLLVVAIVALTILVRDAMGTAELCVVVGAVSPVRALVLRSRGKQCKDDALQGSLDL
jgi:hypothetical protein